MCVSILAHIPLAVHFSKVALPCADSEFIMVHWTEIVNMNIISLFGIMLTR